MFSVGIQVKFAQLRNVLWALCYCVYKQEMDSKKWTKSTVSRARVESGKAMLIHYHGWKSLHLSALQFLYLKNYDKDSYLPAFGEGSEINWSMYCPVIHRAFQMWQ